MVFKIKSCTTKKHVGFIFSRDKMKNYIFLPNISRRSLKVISFDGINLMLQNSNFTIKAKKIKD